MSAAELPTDGAAGEAIRAAERWLVKQGWKYTPADVGSRAKEILEAMYGAHPLQSRKE